jgi:bifunctional pyridoxal-dependent enzyme with beta-cystathionase and maltose regulon repressor activities
MTLDQYLEGVKENQRFMNERKDKTKHEVQFTEQLNLYVEWLQVPKF